MNNKPINRRRDLLPLWIKFFTWIYLIFGVSGLILLVIGLFFNEVNLSIYGIASDRIYSTYGILIIVLFIFNGIIAYGLWCEKDWGPKLGIIGAIIGIGICSYIMLIIPFLYGSRNFTIRIELIILIPYLLKLQKLQKIWLRIKQ